MKNTILILAFLFTSLSCGRDTHTKKIETNFETAFTKVKEIPLDSNTVFDIRYIDVNDDNDLLITNKPRTEVFLYDSLGNLKARLSENLDKEFPGGNWAPTQGYFFKNGEIFVANRVPWGIRFDREGNFKNFMTEEYQGTPYLAFDNQNNIYSYTNDYRGFYISKYNSDGTEISRISDIDSTYKNIMARVISDYTMTVAGDFLYYRNLSKPNIYKYTLSGELTDIFSEQPAYYKAPEKDISIMKLPDDAAVRKFGRRIKDFAQKYTANVAIHQLDEELLLVQYINYGGTYGHQVLTTDGEYILDYDLYTKNEILAAKDGYVYLVDDTDPTSPRIVVYRFSGYLKTD